MSKFSPPLHAGSIILKIVVLSLTLALISTASQTIKGLPFEVGNLMHNLLVIPSYWITILAPGFYLCALWALSDVFGRLNRGDAFGPNMIRGLKGVGSNLMYGAFTAIILAPTLSVLFANEFRSLAGIKHDNDIENLTIGLIGLALYALAKRGQALKSELEQFV